MKIYLVSLAICFSSVVHAQQKDLELWYKQPAATWTDALPIGNGRIGAMVYGNASHEIIQLNEESVWAGSKMNNNNPEAKAHLPEIQAAIFRKDYKEALSLSKKYMIGTPPNVRSYQPLGNLFVDYQWKSAPTNYRRSLNINNGISTTSYSVDGNNVVQEAFASAPHDLLIVRIKADKPIDFSLLLSREFSGDNEVKDKRKMMITTLIIIHKNSKQKQYYL